MIVFLTYFFQITYYHSKFVSEYKYITLLLSDERRELGSVEAIEKLHNIYCISRNLVFVEMCGMSNHSSIKTLCVLF